MKLIALSILILCVQSAYALEKPGYFFDGNQLHELCKADRKLVHGYVMGFSDAIAVSDELGKKNSVCTPPNAKSGQMVDIVCRELEQHPEVRHWTAAYIVRSALQEAWPCGNQ